MQSEAEVGSGSSLDEGYDLRRRIEARAEAIGLDLFGVSAAGPVDGFEQFLSWADEGRAGEMQWLTWEPKRRSDPRVVMPGCRSVIVAGSVYGGGGDDAEIASANTVLDRDDSEADEPAAPILGRVARYARGKDYHVVLKEQLEALLEAVREETKRPVQARIYVDTGPLLERDLAYSAGLGWRAKNTNLIHERKGSYFFLGEILLDLDLPPSIPKPDRCGSCTRCLDACPTSAFLGPGVLDANRCISYLTIELRGAIPRDLRPMMGAWVFGCDICQEVCPWNRHASAAPHAAYKPGADLEAPDLIRLLKLTQEEFSALFRGSAIKRTKRRGLARNAAVALGNSRDPRAVPALIEALEDPEPLVRGHAAWALGRFETSQAIDALRARLNEEADRSVREELELALHADGAR